MQDTSEIQRLVSAAAAGERAAFDQLVPLLYADLRQIAHRQLHKMGAGETWSTTALVHESYLRLAGHAGGYEGLRHFLAVSARVMRNILVDYARRRRAAKRGGAQEAETLDDLVAGSERAIDEVLAFEQVLLRLAEVDPRLVQVVECRVFAGYTEEETARALDLSVRTVQRTWQRARAWLAEEIRS